MLPFNCQMLTLVTVMIERGFIPGHRHFLVPHSKNPHFWGREGELTVLDEYLTEVDYDTSSNYPIVAVHGLGGVGYANSSLIMLGTRL